MNVDRFPWLKDALNANQNLNFSSSIIIEGQSGLAKSKLAEYFAQKLLCTNGLNDCDNCNSCSYFLAGSHPDYCFLSNDTCSSVLHTYSKAKKDSLTSKKIEGIRSLNEFISMTHSVSKKRVAVIFDANLMNINAQNALLKTLEELPENKHIFIVSNQRKYFLPTIYSRSSIISINNDKADLYIKISQNLNSYCLGRLTTPDLLKFYKETHIPFDEKINSIILFLKTCLGINQDFYKSHPSITLIEKTKLDAVAVSDLIEELVDYKFKLNKVPALNEQIGLNNFFYKIKNLVS